MHDFAFLEFQISIEFLFCKTLVGTPFQQKQSGQTSGGLFQESKGFFGRPVGDP